MAKNSTAKVQTPLRVGNSVYVRTVTYHFTGRVVGASKEEILLADAAWIPDSGRWADALEKGALHEVEPYPAGTVVSIGRGAITDACDWKHALPRTQK